MQNRGFVDINGKCKQIAKEQALLATRDFYISLFVTSLRLLKLKIVRTIRTAQLAYFFKYV